MMRTTHQTLRGFGRPALFGALFGALVAPALSQQREAGLALEEVVVTGVLKQEASLLETPVSVTALDSESLERRGVNSLGDLADGQMPSLRIQPYANNPSTISIGLRGLIAADAGSVGVEAPVAVNVDGVYLGRMQGLAVDMVELERLEVLRGPQGTLFGRNAIGGVVNMVSKKPTGELGISQRLTVGSDYGELRSLTRVDLPEMGGVSARLSGMVRTYDGYVENPALGADLASDPTFSIREQEDFYKNDQTAFRLALNWESERVSVDYSFDLATIENSQAYFQSDNGLSRIGITPAMSDYCEFDRSIRLSGPTGNLALAGADFGKYVQCSVYATTLASLVLAQGGSGPPPALAGLIQAVGGFTRAVETLTVSRGATSATALAGSIMEIGQVFGQQFSTAVATVMADTAITGLRNALGDGSSLGEWIPSTGGEQAGRQDAARSPLYMEADETEHTAHALVVNLDLGDFSLKSVTSYRELEETLNNNYNGALTGFGASGVGGFTMFDEMDMLQIHDDADITQQEQLSQDLQLSGSLADGRLGFVAGFYFFSEDIEESQGAFHVVYDYVNLGRGRTPTAEVIETPYPVVIPLLYDGQPRSLAVPVCLTCVPGDERSAFNSKVEFEATSTALYGQLTYSATEQFDLTFGLRFTQDDREGVSLVSNSTFGLSIDATTPTLAVTPTELDDDNLDFALIASFDIDERNNFYGRIATGYKAGGISRRAISFNTFEKETLTSFEFGYKGRLWDDRLGINAAVFAMDHKDKQAALREHFFTPDATVANTLGSNLLGTTSVTGAEVELWLQASEGLRLGLDLSLLDWDVPLQDQDRLCPATIGECAPGPAAGDFPDEFFLPHAPDWATSVSVDYAFAPFAFGTLDFHLDANTSGDYHPNPTDEKIDGYTVVNARAALRNVAARPRQPGSRCVVEEPDR